MARKGNRRDEIGEGPVRGKAGRWGRMLATAAALGMGLALLGPGCTPAEVEETATPEVSRVSQGDALMTSRAESASTLGASATDTSTPNPWIGQPPTPRYTPVPTPIPALPSADGGPMPPGAIARLGIGSIRAAALSPDGELVAVGTTAGMYIYRADTLERLWARMIEAPVNGVAWSPDGRLVAVWFDQKPIVIVHNALTGVQEVYLEHTATIGDADWSPDGTRLAVGWSARQDYWMPPSNAPWSRVTVWDVAGPSRVFTGEMRYEGDCCIPPVFDVEWSPDGNTIAVVTDITYVDNAHEIHYGDVVVLWDALTGTQTFVLEHSNVHRAAFSPDGALIATWSLDDGSDTPRGSSKVLVWDVSTGSLVHQLEGDTGFVYSVAWSPDGRRLASGMGSWVEEGPRTIIWDVQTGTRLTSALFGHQEGQVSSLAWSPDGRYLLVGLSYYYWPFVGGPIVWDTTRGNSEFEVSVHGRTVSMVGWTANGQNFISASYDAILLYTLQQAEPLRALRGIGTHVPIHNLAWLSPTSLVATNSDDSVVSWDISSGQPTQLGDGAGVASQQEEFGVASPDGSLRADVGFFALGTGYPERFLTKVMISDSSGAIIYQFDGPRADHLLMAWSPDGTRLAVGGGLEPAFKGNPFVEGWEENAVMVWDITTGSLLHTFLGHTGRVYSLAWSPDGTLLASGSADGTVIIWDVRG